MKMTYLYLAAFAFTALVACNNKDTANEATTTDSTAVTDANLRSSDSLSTAVQTIQAPGEISATSPAANAPADGLNPAHGMPGHRCDIAVGASLASAPAPAPTADPKNMTITTDQMGIQGASQVNIPPPPTAQPNSIMSTPTTATPGASAPAAATTTAPGMNPPHGAPGHDCAVAVGAPLKK
ncbi:MAG: hypothetical protein IPP71_03410 [Bacteroidetes bacterium]|nr:hypothetical protein [Bacteroidota bacterium]